MTASKTHLMMVTNHLERLEVHITVNIFVLN